MIKHATRALLVVVGLTLWSADAGATASTGELFHDGEVVGTVVNPGAIPHEGRDAFYMVTNGAEGQLGIAGVAPGDAGYHGGSWAVSEMTFVEGVDPYLLTSDEAVDAAAAAGDVEVTRTPEADFRCPVTQP